MAEWLTHVLFAFAMCTPLSWYSDWLDQKWVAVAMVGSIFPDINRLGLLLSDELMSYLIGSQFAWSGIHTVAGIVLLSGIGAVLFRTDRQRRRAFGMLLAGALSHLLVDLPQRYADGRMISNFYTFPIPAPRPPTPGWYVSPDRWVVVIALVTAIVVFLLDYHRKGPTSQ
jgi:hypothetical protein